MGGLQGIGNFRIGSKRFGETSMDEVEMRTTWKAFVKGEHFEAEKVRPEILKSWRRCLGRVSPFQRKNETILGSRELEKICNENKELIEVSAPVMDDLYKFVMGSGHSIQLSDKTGYILKLIGDKDIVEKITTINHIPGANWSEDVMGTNAIGTCLRDDRPIQVYRYEHWSLCVQTGVCSASPIHDPATGEIIGTLSIGSAHFERVHSHTLGMVVAAVHSIEAQIAAQRNWVHASISNKYKALIMESISEGLITIDNEATITQINEKAIDFLKLYRNPCGENIFHMLKKRFGNEGNYKDLISVLKAKDDVDAEFITITDESGIIKCTITSRCMWEGANVAGKTIAIQEISKFKQVVNRVAGNRALAVFEDIIGKNEKFLGAVQMAVRASKTSSNVLLVGESGTGKDLFAQAIHNNSSRRNGPYIALNCGAVPRDLLESELFGFMDGAFTGARRGGNPGKFELADQGTIFLDEIGEMALGMQVSLLRVIEEKAVMRIGGKEVIPTDVRIIAATNRNLVKEMELKNFRFDLYYRLNVVMIEIPPLRERKDDIPLLINCLTEKLCSSMGKGDLQIDEESIDQCMMYSWPGNVRELQNVIEKGIICADTRMVSLRNIIPFKMGQIDTGGAADQCGEKKLFKSIVVNAESEGIRSTLIKNKGNKCLAAKELGIARSTLYRKLERLGL